MNALNGVPISTLTSDGFHDRTNMTREVKGVVEKFARPETHQTYINGCLK